MKYFLLCLYFFCFKTALCQDTLSLNDKANIAILESIEKLPPVIQVQFFINGKQKRSGYKVYAISNGKRISTLDKGLIKLDFEKIKKEDSMIFILKYKQNNITSKTYSCMGFLHGGKFIAGILSDFNKERNKYLQDTALYFQNNLKNYLYYFIKKNEVSEKHKKNMLLYSVIKNNTNAWNDYRYEFKKD